MGTILSKNSGTTQTNRDATLSEYLECLYKEEVCFKRDAKEIADITDAVQQLVGRIIETVGQTEKRLTCSNIHFVGSMAEGTRIIEPDEFDFLAVVDDLSTGEGIAFLPPYNHLPYGTFRVQPDTSDKEFMNKWKDIVCGILFQSFKQGLCDVYLKVLQNVVRTLKQNTFIKTKTGELSIYDVNVKQHGPACLCTFVWVPESHYELTISVDICPAIRVTDVDRSICETLIYYRDTKKIVSLSDSEGYIDQMGFRSDSMYARLKEVNGLLLIPLCGPQYKNWECKLTSTILEVKLMKGLSEQHKKCYKLLKHLFQLFDLGFFHSFSLKTFVLKHDLNDKCLDGKISKCVLKIVDDVKKCIEPDEADLCKNVPHALLPPIQIFPHGVCTGKYITLKRAIRHMQQDLRNISSGKISIMPTMTLDIKS